MALNKDVLGTGLYNVRKSFSDKTIQQLIDQYGSLEGAREAQAKSEADVIINHFKTAGVVSVTVATTGTAAAQSGTGTGSIA